MDFLKNKNIYMVLTYCIGLIFLLYNISFVWALFMRLWGVLSPFVMGFVIAYVLYHPLRLLREKMFRPLFRKAGWKEDGSLIRVLSIVVVYLLVLLALVALFSVVLPQLVTSISTLVSNTNVYLNNFYSLVERFTTAFPFGSEVIAFVNEYWAELWKAFSDFLNQLLPMMVDAAVGITSGIANFAIGVVASIYLLLNKEKLSLQVKKLLYAGLPEQRADQVMDVANLVHETFGGFISGQLLDALIIGVLCFVAMTILRLPYALLISTIVGMTNVIPYFGPILGAIPGTFLILVNNPVQALIFVAMIVVLQQCDGNIISPRIVGSSIGLSGLWVLFSITVGGSLFGIKGMVLGLPTFAVAYKLLGRWTRKRLSEKNLRFEAAAEPVAEGPVEASESAE